MGKVSPIDEDMYHKRWRCCCGCMHVRTGSMLIGFIKLLFLGGMAKKAQELHWHSETIMADMALTGFLAAVFLFTGLSLGKPGFLTLHMVYQFLSIIALMSGFVMSIIVVVLLHLKKVEPEPDTIFEHGIIHHAIHAGVMFFVACIEIWFLWVVYRCYQCFRVKELRGEYALRKIVDELMEDEYV